MTQPSDIRFFFEIEEDRVLLANHMTVGRHLDNDVLLAGEDVLDYHLRIEMTDRGPRAIPLGEASLQVNGQDLTQAVGLMPGDRLLIGQNELILDAEPMAPPEADQWRLHSSTGFELTIQGICGVGRGEDNELHLEDDHVSRYHARLTRRNGIIWLRDLSSANGTFVNGQQITGACRLFHGDEVRFDTARYQLVGRGADLTPVREDDAAPQPLKVDDGWNEPAGTDTTEFAAVDAAADTVAELEPAAPAAGETGAFLLGASEPVAALTFRMPMGRTVIGRSEECDLVIRDRTVSSRHAELTVRSDGITISNLMSTNGTRVNGDEVQTARLQDGDVLRLGRVSLVFKDVPAEQGEAPWLRRTQMALLVGSLILAVGLISYLF